MLATRYQPCENLPMMTLVAHKGCLVALDWQTQKTQTLLAKISKQAQYVSPNDLTTGVDNANANVNTNANAKVLVHTIKQLNQYFNGQRQAFDIALDLTHGTPFQQKVCQALLHIAYGQTVSYATLAATIGQPTAYRAVANANGKNPISLIVPCHRVIASDGGLGGYTGGVVIKQTLLKLEQGLQRISH